MWENLALKNLYANNLKCILEKLRVYRLRRKPHLQFEMELKNKKQHKTFVIRNYIIKTKKATNNQTPHIKKTISTQLTSSHMIQNQNSAAIFNFVPWTPRRLNVHVSDFTCHLGTGWNVASLKDAQVSVRREKRF